MIKKILNKTQKKEYPVGNYNDDIFMPPIIAFCLIFISAILLVIIAIPFAINAILFTKKK